MLSVAQRLQQRRKTAKKASKPANESVNEALVADVLAERALAACNAVIAHAAVLALRQDDGSDEEYSIEEAEAHKKQEEDHQKALDKLCDAVQAFEDFPPPAVAKREGRPDDHELDFLQKMLLAVSECLRDDKSPNELSEAREELERLEEDMEKEMVEPRFGILNKVRMWTPSGPTIDERLGDIELGRERPARTKTSLVESEEEQLWSSFALADEGEMPSDDMVPLNPNNWSAKSRWDFGASERNARYAREGEKFRKKEAAKVLEAAGTSQAQIAKDVKEDWDDAME